MDVITNLQTIARLADSLLGRGASAGGPDALQSEIRAVRHLIGTRTPSVMVDIGGNRGDYTVELLAAFPGATIHLVEPQQALARALGERFAGRSVTVHRLAFSDQGCEAPLFSDAPVSGLASLYRRDLRHVALTMESAETVPVVRFDTWADRHLGGQVVDFVKIDVEGAELAVLKGMGAWLQRVRLIQFEFGGTAIDARTFFRDYYYFLRNSSFNILRLSPLGLIEVNSYTEHEESFLYQVFFAMRSA
jgi:FkbM family methyltransferase